MLLAMCHNRPGSRVSCWCGCQPTRGGLHVSYTPASSLEAADRPPDTCDVHRVERVVVRAGVLALVVSGCWSLIRTELKNSGRGFATRLTGASDQPCHWSEHALRPTLNHRLPARTQVEQRSYELFQPSITEVSTAHHSHDFAYDFLPTQGRGPEQCLISRFSSARLARKTLQHIAEES